MDNSNKKVVLVTGSSGLVGWGIKTSLNAETDKQNEEWVFLSSKDGDLRKYEDTAKIFEKYKPTHCLHLAAYVGGLFRNLKYKSEFFDYNMLINMNVLRCCKEFKLVKVVSCLSTCIFPDKTKYPINEQMLHDGAPHPSNEGYAYAKRMVDVMNRCYSSGSDCIFTSVIPTNIYGPHDNFNIENGHVLPGLMHKCHIANSLNGNFEIWGSGKPLRQFIYSEDLGKLMIWTLRHYNETSPIILSVDPEDEVSIADVASIIAKNMSFKGTIKYDTSKSDGQYKKTADNAKLRSLLPQFEFTTIDSGIQKTVKWFTENYENAKK